VPFACSEPKTPERLVRNFTCFFCESKFESKYDLQQHQDVCDYRPDGMEFLRFMPSKEPCRSEKRAFLENFNLITTGKAEVLSRHKQDVVCDVIIVESSDDEDCEIEISSSPFTSDNAFLKHSPRKLSSEIRPARMKRSATVSARSRAAKLLRIDVCSPLGLRLKHHICVSNVRDSNAFSVSNVNELERYCKEVPIVNCSLDMSFRPCEEPRFRKPKVSPLFTVTYRQSRIFKYCHSYKFSRRQRADFCRTYDTGLNARSRNRLKLMKPSTVVIRKLPLKQLQKIDCVTRSTDNLELRCERSVCEYCRFCVSQFKNSHVLCDTDLGLHMCNTFTAETLKEDASDLRISFRRAGSHNTADWAIVARSSVSPTVGASPEASPRNSSPFGGRHCIQSHGIAQTGVVAAVETNSSVTTCTTGHLSELAVRRHLSHCDANTQLPTDYPSKCVHSSEMKPPGFSLTDGHRLAKLWSKCNRMPSITFHCAVCDKKVVTPEANSKSVIYSHYAAHGIFNISVVTATLPNGQIDLKLVEVPQNSAAQPDQHQIMPVTSNCTADKQTVLDEALLSSKTTTRMPARNSLSATPCLATRLHGKQKHVKWADQELTTDEGNGLLQSVDILPSTCTAIDNSNVSVESSKSTTEPLLGANIHLSASGLTWVAKPNEHITHKASEFVLRRSSPTAFPAGCQTSNNPVVSLPNMNEHWVNDLTSYGTHQVLHALVSGPSSSSWLQQSILEAAGNSVMGSYPNSVSDYSTHSKAMLHTPSMVQVEGDLERYNDHIRNAKSPSDVLLNNQTSAPPFASACPNELNRVMFGSQDILSSDVNQRSWVSPTNFMSSVTSNQAAITMASTVSSSSMKDTLVRCMQAVLQQTIASLSTSGQRPPTSQSSAQVPADGIICID